MVGFTDCKLASMSQTRKYSVFQLNSRNPGSENVSPNWPEVRNCFFNGLAPFKSSQKDLEFSIETANVFLLGIKFQAFLVFVLLYSALSPQTEWHISHRDLFLSSESWDVPELVSVRTCFLRFTCSPLTAGLCRQRRNQALWVSFIRTLIPLARASPSQPNHLPKPHLLILSYSCWASPCRFEGTQTFT